MSAAQERALYFTLNLVAALATIFVFGVAVAGDDLTLALMCVVALASILQAVCLRALRGGDEQHGQRRQTTDDRHDVGATLQPTVHVDAVLPRPLGADRGEAQHHQHVDGPSRQVGPQVAGDEPGDASPVAHASTPGHGGPGPHDRHDFYPVQLIPNVLHRGDATSSLRLEGLA